MNLLFVISIACFFALFVTALGIARHVRSQELRLQEAEQRSKAAFVPHRSDRQDLVLPRTVAQTPDRLLRYKEPDWRFLVSHLGRRRFVMTSAAPRGDRSVHKALPMGLLQECTHHEGCSYQLKPRPARRQHDSSQEWSDS